jgi:hypothetical protein
MSAAVPPPAAMTDEEERLLGRVELTSESAFLRLRGIFYPSSSSSSSVILPVLLGEMH